DQPAWVDSFLARFYDPQLCFTHSEEGQVVAMAHIVPLTTELGRTAYLYAVAVDEFYRGRGLARKVISDALAKVREGWGGEFDAVCVIPADESLRVLYAKFGFADKRFAMSFGSRGGDRLGEECFVGAHSTFDLGTGNPESDLAMVLRLRD
ncbi:MAG: GNAT family N-acetyltransferase, partial [Rikenellaceae bacterium]|nr:GNAT family N-acetyltransferase [Rikenellaceae bacterium]